jgi:hypothetical protein
MFKRCSLGPRQRWSSNKRYPLVSPMSSVRSLAETGKKETYKPRLRGTRSGSAFPEARRVRPKTGRGDGSRRARWKDRDGRIYEWDAQHGSVEQYDARGRHLGQFDPVSGERQKGPDRTRRIEP